MVLTAAAVIGAIIGVAPALYGPKSSVALPASLGEPITGCRVTDGDTIRCGDERIRLLAIDAPELPGHCRPGRVCAPGDPYASTESLKQAMTGKLTIIRAGEDRYGRTLAQVSGAKGDLSCWQLEHKQVIYKANWDDSLRVAGTCPSAVRR